MRIDRRTPRQLQAIETRRQGLGFRRASKKSTRKAYRKFAIGMGLASFEIVGDYILSKQPEAKSLRDAFDWQSLTGKALQETPYNPKRVGIQGCGTDFAHPILADMLGHHSEEKTGRYNLLSESRIGEFTLKTVAHPYDLFDDAIHVSFNASETHQEKLGEVENRKTVVEEYEKHRQAGGKPSDYPGPFLTVDVFAYDKSEKLPKRPMPKQLQRPGNYRDSGIRFKREFARQTICRKVPKVPATITEKQISHWGNEASYYVRQDGEQVAIHPFKAIASDFLGQFVRLSPTNKADAREWLEHVETNSPESLNYARVIYGSFKKCVHEWGASGQTFENDKTGKRTRFSWGYFYNYVCDIVSRFWAIEGNQNDSKFSPVLDSFRYAVNYEKQSTTHQLRQHHSESSESVAIIRDIKPHADNSPNVRKINRESLTKRQLLVVNAITSGKAASDIGVSPNVWHGVIREIRQKMAKGK